MSKKYKSRLEVKGGCFENNVIDLSDEIIPVPGIDKSTYTLNIMEINKISIKNHGNLDDGNNHQAKKKLMSNITTNSRLSTISLPDKIATTTITTLTNDDDVKEFRSSPCRPSPYSWISSTSPPSSSSSSSSSSSTSSSPSPNNYSGTSKENQQSTLLTIDKYKDTKLSIFVRNQRVLHHNPNNHNNNNNNGYNFFYSNHEEQPQHPQQQPTTNFKPNKFIEISRNVLDMDTLAEVAGERNPEKETEDGKTFWKRLTGKRKTGNEDQCSQCADCLRYYIPILDWLPKYPIKSYLIPDMIAGLTISILHIPQGIAYSMLAGLEPVHGLYVSFFPVLIYVLLGTSSHISVGTFAIASIMLNNIATKMGAFNRNMNIKNESWTEMPPTSIPTALTTILPEATTLDSIIPMAAGNNNPTALEVLTSVCLLCGFIQIVMSLLRLGSLSLILSEQLVSAFSTAVAFHVATSQLSSIFGYTNLALARSGPFKLIKTWIILSKHLKDINIYCFTFSIISIIILVISKELIEPKMKKFSSFPLPIDLILVVTTILISWLFNFNLKFNIQVVKMVPTGLPKPTVPRFDLMPDIFIDSLVLSLVCFAVSLSLAKIFAKKHNQTVRPNQELLALGCANVFSSFFLAYPCSGALSRSTLQEKVGGKTQIAGLVSSTIVLTVLLFLAPFLYHLPKFTLSCIVLVALKSMFLQISDVQIFWKISKLDGAAWIITFLSVIILDIDYGLIIGIFAAILVILIKLAFPKASILGHLVSTEIYIENENYNNLLEYSGIKIFRFSSPLFYLNIDSFKERIMKIYSETFESATDETRKALIMDLSGLSFIDKTGIDSLIDVIKMFQKKQIHIFLTHCPYHIIETLRKTNFFQKVEHPEIVCKLFPTNHDAVIGFY